MNTDRYYDAEPLPADQLVLDFIEDNFLRWRQNPNIVAVGDRVTHLVVCSGRVVSTPEIRSALACIGGTCESDPELTAVISCPHAAIEWSVEDETMAGLLGRIAEFADARRAS